MAHENVLSKIVTSLSDSSTAGIDMYKCIKEPLVLELDPSAKFRVSKAYFATQEDKVLIKDEFHIEHNS